MQSGCTTAGHRPDLQTGVDVVLDMPKCIPHPDRLFDLVLGDVLREPENIQLLKDTLRGLQDKSKSKAEEHKWIDALKTVVDYFPEDLQY